MTEQLHLDFAGGVLLDTNPKVRPEVVQESHGSSASALKELESDIHQHPIVSEHRSRETVDDFLIVNLHNNIYHSTAEQQQNAQKHSHLQEEAPFGPQEWR